ncbi:MAG: O-methyltransferase [Thiohalocapsa sp.]|jgi:predicted O-methyltransferase YrrM|uniref:O-methyltransferase n=1 Tax=Thiohalocapsa sp. TaxID=2497641 RepID=UPI0025E7D3AB|nr:O-methyltransferase [Thiohalocapsa sp.]MCG6943398.1 O-methyltransferase [Thiohalocapsa sp.]
MSDTVLPALLQSYLDTLVPERPPELRAMEARAAAEGFPIIGPACGQVCYLVARMVRARRVFELGSGFGYSTAWFARALQETHADGGEVHHTVWDPALSDQARRHLAALGLDARVHFHVGEAVAALAGQPGGFDLVFSDIDKEGYPDSLPVIERQLRPGGVLIVDNMLWGNRVLDPRASDPATEAIRRFTRSIADSRTWSGSILPIRDGLLLALRT